MLQKADQPFLVDLIEERSDVGVQYEAHFLAVDTDAERVQRVVRAAPRSESIRYTEEVLLVDRVQQRDHRPLDDLVLQRVTASGRCRPSGLGTYTRRLGSARYAPR